jgi:hypothetical protein
MLLAELELLSGSDQIEFLNEIREILHGISPFKNEPVDFVRWEPSGNVVANDYNPNAVAPPEMELLAHSIGEDGFTQPIVAWESEGAFEVVDGFHRNRVGKEVEPVKERLRGYLPLAVVNASRLDRGDRMRSLSSSSAAIGPIRKSARNSAWSQTKCCAYLRSLGLLRCSQIVSFPRHGRPKYLT